MEPLMTTHQRGWGMGPGEAGVAAASAAARAAARTAISARVTTRGRIDSGWTTLLSSPVTQPVTQRFQTSSKLEIFLWRWPDTPLVRRPTVPL